MNRRALIFCWCCLVATQLVAAEVKIFRSDSQEAFLEGTLEGVSIDPLRGLELAHRLELLTDLAEPFVFSAAALGEGWVVGTGNEGRVLKVDHQGKVEVLYEAPQLEVFAVLADRDGTVLAATSPYGKVVRIADGGVEEIFDPPEAYIWDLARDSSGRLLVATGLEGRLYRLAKGEKAGADAEVLIDGNDRHLRVLEPRADGSVLIGTAGQGMILRLDAKGEVSTLYDALQPEVLAFAAAPSGSIYAALVASEASYVDLSSSVAVGQNGDEGAADGQVTVTVQGQETLGSRAAGANGPRSVVVEISSQGGIREVLSFTDETAYALMWHEDQLWIGTGQEGKLYRYAEERLVLERELDDRQLTAMAKGRAGAAVLTTNPARVHLFADVLEERGVYTSKIFDAGEPSRFGSLVGRAVDGRGAVEFSVRSGMSSQPDATWSSWSAPRSGVEVALTEMPSGRYVQWRAILKGGDAGGPRLSGVELSYQQVNQTPVLKSFEVLAPGEILVPSAFNPGNQTFEPWSPDREGIFTTLKPAESSDDGRLKTLWKKGYRTLRWQASDPNEDSLRYELEVRPETADTWLPMVEETTETYYSFDSTVLPDGSYRFRVRAWDRAVDEAEAASAERLSTPVMIDHTPPRMVSAERRGEHLEVVLEDAQSPLRDVVFSLDAGEWRSVTTADGVLDGRREVVHLPVSDDARMLLLRATDAGFNVITFDLLKAKAKVGR